MAAQVVTDMIANLGKSGDARFFQTTKKGEIMELKTDLNSLNKDVVKNAVKKVIASMTVGKDVSSLFTDVLKSMQTDNIELKKLVYLYIINYARSQPDKAILVVNTFQKDAMSSSPLIRALAIRTMGCIRVDRITEYLAEPLAKAIKDKDPYVRKTAAIAIAKMYDINPELVEEQGMVESLKDMVADPNPMVVANAVAALQEIQSISGKDSVFEIDSAMLAKLLAALNECTEWGQVFILDALARFEPTPKDAEEIIERVTPRLKHANSAVSMSAIKVILKYLSVIKGNDKLEQSLLQEKLPPPLITLLSEHKPEIQYVALRNINLIVQKQPNILQNGVKHFFAKYNDPIYVKMEKLEIMVRLASVKNIEKVLMEFKEYASEVDVEFVRKSVLAIGRCAIKIEKAAERCIQVLLELIQTKVNYVVQEAIIVIKDIFRKYPNRYESIIATLCENLDTLDEPEAKASMIWIIGEYADRIDNAPELLESFVEHFDDENPQVQLQLLTAVVKLFLKRPDDAKELVGKILNQATSNADNPDLRDRGYVYWRLLSTDPEAAQSVVLAQKPVINDDTHNMDPAVLEVLIANIATLASIYHKPPEMFVKDHKSGVIRRRLDEKESDDESEEESDEDEENGVADSEQVSDEDEESDEDDKAKKPAAAAGKPAAAKSAAAAPPPSSGGMIDLLGLGGFAPAPVSNAPAAKPASSGFDYDFGGSAAPSTSLDDPLKVVLSAEQAKGLQISSRVARRGGQLFLDFEFRNNSGQQLSQFALKFNANFLGLSPGGPLTPGVIPNGQSKTYAVPLVDNQPPNPANIGIIQIAIKTELGVFYFNQPAWAYTLFSEDGQVPDQAFIAGWKEIPDGSEATQPVSNRTVNSIDQIKGRFGPHNLFFINSRPLKPSGTALYFSAKLKGVQQLIEIKIDGQNTIVGVKSKDNTFAQAVLHSVAALLTR